MEYELKLEIEDGWIKIFEFGNIIGYKRIYFFLIVLVNKKVIVISLNIIRFVIK